MLKLTRYLIPYWKSVILAPMLMLIEVAMDLLQPMLMASIIDYGVMTGDLSHIQRTGAVMIGVAVIGLLGGVGCTIFSSIASLHFGADLRRDLFGHVQSFSFRTLDRFASGSLITRLTSDIVQLQNLVQMTLRVLVRAPLLALGSLIMALAISPKLGLILAVVIPLLFIALFLLFRFTIPLFSKVQMKLDAVNMVLQENFTGIRVIKAFVRGLYENSRFGASNDDYRETATRAARAIALNMPIMSLLMNVSIVAVLWFGGAQVRSGSLPIGDLVAFINYVTQVLFSLLMVSMVLMNVSRAKVSADRVNEVMETQSDIRDTSASRTDVVRNGRVEFDHVFFSYGTSDARENVLKDIHFTAEAGRTVAILGSTGSGKSTLVSLIPRLYEATQGTVRIDGTDVNEIELQHLRSRIGVVLQQSILFTGTIRDNLCFGKPHAAQEEIEAAAKAAQAHDFIMAMPDGYDTRVGQRGVNLSGGQKQRISIARALLVKPAILILDDSTSAIDLATEARIQEALKELIRASTCLLIAQRISSVIDADHIIVMDEGRIAAEGTHDELIRTSRVYQDIYKSQLGREEISHGRR